MSEVAEVAKTVEPRWKCLVPGCKFTTPPTLRGYQQQAGHQLVHANKGVPKAKRVFALIDKGTGEVIARSPEEARVKGYLQEPVEVEAEAKAQQEAEAKAKAQQEAEAEAKSGETKPEAEEAVVGIAKTKAEEKPEAKVEAEAEVKPGEIKPEPEEAVEGIARPKAEEKPEAKVEAEAEAKRGETKPEITVPQPSSEGILRYTITLPADAFTLFNLAKVCDLEKDKEKLFDEWIWDCIRMRYKKDYRMRLILAPEEE